MDERFQLLKNRFFQLLRYGLVAVVLFFWLSWNLPAAASSSIPEKAIATANTTEVKVSLGSPSGELKFFPNTFEFVAGQAYKLLLDNPSPQKHYFTSKDFADASWTKKVEAGNVEVKGAIHELELKPGAEAEWLFVPLKAGTYSLRCTIKGHTEAGMTGEITITQPQQQG